jgi:hypothetical protein
MMGAKDKDTFELVIKTQVTPSQREMGACGSKLTKRYSMSLPFGNEPT